MSIRWSKVRRTLRARRFLLRRFVRQHAWRAMPRLSFESTRLWLALIISLGSFWLAIDTRLLARSEPEVMLLLPDKILLAQGDDFGYAYLYFQPTVASTGKNNRVEIVESMRLEVLEGPGAEEVPGPFVWDEFITFDQDPGSNSLSYRWIANAAPIVISSSTAQNPVVAFTGERGWYFAAGTYRMNLVVERAVGTGTLSAEFEFTLTRQNVDALLSARGNEYNVFPIHRLD